jgi:hypothetical protein
MDISLKDICNNNTLNNPTNEVYKSFNDFIFSNDIKVIGKLLKRFEFFLKVKDLPGDIVELGVYKGSGVSTFSKFLQLYCPNSIKRVIGFDLSLTFDGVNKNLSNIKQNFYELIKGDICITTEEYSKNNPGFRISLLYIDVDLDEPTYFGLTNLWKHIIPGGIILFDEYQYHKFDESNGVDRFLRDNNLNYELLSTNFLAPDCYMIKKN